MTGVRAGKGFGVYMEEPLLESSIVFLSHLGKITHLIIALFLMLCSSAPHVSVTFIFVSYLFATLALQGEH